MKMAVFWVVVPRHHHGDRPDDGGRKDLWNVGKLLLDYTALQPTRQPSSYSPPWEPQIVVNLGIFFMWVLSVRRRTICTRSLAFRSCYMLYYNSFRQLQYLEVKLARSNINNSAGGQGTQANRLNRNSLCVRTGEAWECIISVIGSAYCTDDIPITSMESIRRLLWYILGCRGIRPCSLNTISTIIIGIK
jgi:hypothetical protein